MFALLRRWPSLRRLIVVMFVLPLMFAGGSLVGTLAGESVGNVGSLEISQYEFVNLYRGLEEQFRRQSGSDTLPPAMAEVVAQETRRRLISDYLMRAAAEEKNIAVPQSAIADEIRNMPDFLDEGGEFSLTLFNDYVRDPRQLESQVRQTLRRRPLLAALEARPLTAVREKLAAYRRQQRVVQEASLLVTAVFNIGEDDINRYYSQNQRRYQLREEADWEYVEVSADSVSASATLAPPTGEQITLAYEELLNEDAAQEQRRAAHIFIAGDGEDELRRAQEIVEQARQSPESFAELAREYSEDAGTAADGGDLGLVVRDDLPPAMDSAVFSMEEGDISEPLSVEGGFSIVKMEFSSAPPPRALSEMRDEAEERARQNIAQDHFLDLLERLEGVAHLNIGSLAEVAQEAGTTMQVAAEVLRRPRPGEEHPLFNAEILEQLFTEEILGGETSPAIAVDDVRYIFARSVRHQPASVRPLSEVGGEIAGRLRAAEQIALMRAEGTAAIPEDLEWSAPNTLSLADEGLGDDIDELTANEIFAADLTGGLPAFAMTAEPDMVRIFRIGEIAALPPEEEGDDLVATMLTERHSAAAGAAYLESLTERYDIQFDSSPLE